MTPAERWRALMREAFPNLPGKDQDLYEYAQSTEPGYYMAIVLLTFGRLDAALTILDTIPAPGQSARALARVVDELVEPPVDALADPAGARSWIEAHAPDLTWSEPDGKFVLKTQ